MDESQYNKTVQQQIEIRQAMIFNENSKLKKRPFSSKAQSTDLIDSRAFLPDDDCLRYGDVTQKKSTSKLNQIIPEMPFLQTKSNSTALLYSKFIVKGLKQQKIGVVKNAYRKKIKKQETEAATLSIGYRDQSVKTKTGELVDYIEGEEKTLFSQSRTIHIGSRNLGRASSAKLFGKLIQKQCPLDMETKQYVLSRNQTDQNLQKSKGKKRPTTAKPTRNQDARSSSAYNFNFQQFEPQAQSAVKQNVDSGFVRKQKTLYQNSSLYRAASNRDDLAFLLQSKCKMSDPPIKVETIQSFNHIENNIQRVSNYSRKTSSIYLTNANIDNLLNRKDQCKTSTKIQNPKEFEIVPQAQNIFKEQQKIVHDKKMKHLQGYLSSNFPNKFQIISQQLRRQQKKTGTTAISSNFHELLSKDIDERPQKKDDKIDKITQKKYFEEYIRNCQTLQFKICTKTQQNQQKEQQILTLNIFQCERIIKSYQKYDKSTTKSQQLRKQMVEVISKICRNLKYFLHKPEQQFNKFFTIPFQIFITQEQDVIIQVNSPVSYIYILLNGSVHIVSNFIQEQHGRQSNKFQSKVMVSEYSLYDGQMFGEPTKPSQKQYKCRVTALQQSLILRVRYQDYIMKFMQGLQVEDKLQMLRLLFRMQLKSSQIKQEDLQIISLCLEKQKYRSKSLIFRQNDLYEKVVLIGKGKISAINEYILTKNKDIELDLKLIDKNIKKYKQKTSGIYYPKTNNWGEANHDILNLNLNKMRRENLINYQVLRQNQNTFQYYFMKEQSYFVRGDSTNWSAITQSPSIQPLQYSLISNSDDVEVYLLSKAAFNYLPNNIKKPLLIKAKNQSKKYVKVESMEQVEKWNKYKAKLCSSILKQKKQANCKKL